MNWKPSECIDQFLMEQDVTPQTKADYKLLLEAFFRWIYMQEIAYDQIHRGHILNFKSYLIESKKSTGTVNMYLTCLRRFFTWMDIYEIHPNCTKDVRNVPRILDYSRSALTVEQAKQLLGALETKSIGGKRDAAIIHLMLYCALRTIEICRIDIQDVHSKDGKHWIMIQSKGRLYKDEKVMIQSKPWNVLNEYMKEAGGKEGPLFRSLSRRNPGARLSTRYIRHLVKDLLKKIGLEGREYTTHSLRHTAAIAAFEAGGSLYDVQLLLRHTNQNTTMIYLKSIKRKQREEDKTGKLLNDIF